MTVIKSKMSSRDYEEIVKKVNPFGIRTEDGKTCTFQDYGKCYYYVLKWLRVRFHKGFIDLPLALHKLTHIPIQDAKRIANKFPFVNLDNDIYMCVWEDPESNPKQKAEMIMRSLHTLSDSKFSIAFYDWAWDEFCKQENIKP